MALDKELADKLISEIAKTEETLPVLEELADKKALSRVMCNQLVIMRTLANMNGERWKTEPGDSARGLPCPPPGR